MDDIRVIDMYDDVIRTEQPVLERTGNWAQEFYTFAQAATYLQTVFSDVGRVRQIVEEMKKP